MLSQEDSLVMWVCAIVGHRSNKHPLSRLMNMSLQIWLVGSVVTDGIITISMLSLVSLGPFVSGPLTEPNLLPTSSAEERTQ